MGSKNVITVDDENFESWVLNAEGPVLLDFSAHWCAPCKTLLPLVEGLADATVGRLRVGTVDIDDAPGVVKRLGIRGAPTLVVFHRGKETARHMGVCGRERLAELVSV